MASVLPLFIRRSCLGLIKREKSLEHSHFMFSLVLQCRLPEGILYTAQNKMCLEPIIVTVLSAPPCRQTRLAISGGSKWLRCSTTIYTAFSHPQSLLVYCCVPSSSSSPPPLLDCVTAYALGSVALLLLIPLHSSTHHIVLQCSLYFL